jgi:pimeloyl-ACP methyl ester carboxylesterase
MKIIQQSAPFSRKAPAPVPVALNRHTAKKPFTLSLTSLIFCIRLTLTGVVLGTSFVLSGCFHDSDDKDISEPAPKEPAPKEPAPKISAATLINDPVITQTFSATELKAALVAADLAYLVAADPLCGITVQYINHTTTGLQGEATNATGAVILPHGEDPNCQGERPITLYAHGTAAEKSYNLAALNDPDNPAYNKALVVAASYVGQGDILIAPNYPGYDKSDLSYAPYITAQQGRQMLDGLQAGKLAIQQINTQMPKKDSSPTSAVTYSDKLFLTGYSQGGYVTLATAKALDEIGMTPTAVSPGSGPYAVTAFGDSLMSGNIIYGGTLFLPMLTSSYVAEYGNLLDGIYTEQYAAVAPTLFPTTESVASIYFNGTLPFTRLFEACPKGYDILKNISPPSPAYDFGFGADNYLFNTAFRANYVNDMTVNPDGIYPEFKAPNGPVPTQTDLPIRQAFIDNDLRDYVPKAPVLLCAGNQDPSVTFGVNTYAQALIWQNNSAVDFAMLDVDTTNQTARAADGKLSYISTLPTLIDTPLRQVATELQQGFSSQLEAKLTAIRTATYEQARAEGLDEAAAEQQAEKAKTAAVVESITYHTGVDPYCLQAANSFFAQYR